MMRWAIRPIRPGVLCVLGVALLAWAARGAVVIKKDGTRLEGEVTERGDTVIVRTKSSRLKIPRDQVERILRTSTCVMDRFLAEPTGRDLLLLASRAGVVGYSRTGGRLNLQRTEELAKKVAGEADVIKAGEKLLDAMRLTPEHTAEAVKRNVEAFRKEFGENAKEIESLHYHVLTTLGDTWARKIAARMDGIFNEYEKRLVFKEKIKDRFVVKVYSSAMEYHSHGGPPGSAAYYSPTRRELVGYRQRQEDLLFRSLYHEGMHQFLHFYVPNPPIWFDEGLAKYFENAKPMRHIRSSRVPSYRVGGKDYILTSAVKMAMRQGAAFPLKRLIGMSKREFYSMKRQLAYSQAWAFTHMLIESGTPQLKKMWTDYFFGLRDGASQEEINEKVFGKANFRVLENYFKKYVNKL